jgi:hypothetical protein
MEKLTDTEERMQYAQMKHGIKDIAGGGLASVMKVGWWEGLTLLWRQLSLLPQLM